MSEKFENGTSARRRTEETRTQRPRGTGGIPENGSKRPLTEEELRARKRRIAEKKRRKKREKRINIVCAVIAIIAFSAAICSGVFFFKEKKAYDAVLEQKADADQQALEIGRKYEKMKEEISDLEKEIADLKTNLPQE